MTAQKRTQIVITTVALCAAAAHPFWPNLKIDAITLVLLLAASVPWLLRLFKEIEFPGGWKFKFADLQNSEQRAEQVGLLDEPVQAAPQNHEYSFQLVADEDPNLALAGLRIEIERKLNQLVETVGITAPTASRTKMSVGQTLRLLSERGILTSEQSSVLSGMVGLLNSAVHGASVDKQAARWALEV